MGPFQSNRFFSTLPKFFKAPLKFGYKWAPFDTPNLTFLVTMCEETVKVRVDRSLEALYLARDGVIFDSEKQSHLLAKFARFIEPTLI